MRMRLRYHAILALIIFLAGMAIVIYCGSIVGYAFRHSGHSAFSSNRFTYLFSDEFQHANKSMIQGGFVVGMIISIIGYGSGLLAMRRWFRATRASRLAQKQARQSK